jgi:hypothetical protein
MALDGPHKSVARCGATNLRVLRRAASEPRAVITQELASAASRWAMIAAGLEAEG